jgi:hypothetical protein
MKLIVDLGPASMWKRSLALGMAVRHLLQSTALVNERILEINRHAHKRSGGRVPLIPPLYLSGVRYQEEPVDWSYEHFDTIPVVMTRAWGDCDDLAPWRAAELRFTKQDPKADVMVKWKTNPASGRKLYHVVVRRSNARADGKNFIADKFGVYEDPSKVLGMGGAALAAHAGLV